MRTAAVASVFSVFFFAVISIACTKPTPPSPSVADAAATPVASSSSSSSTTTSLSTDDGRGLMKGACLSCHAEEMLAQQRLTHAQWTKVVTKMVTWGANLEPKDTEAFIGWLASTYGPDAGVYELTNVGVADAPLEIAATPDGPFANGDAERGKPIYVDKCSGCHGAEAKGHIGVLLIDRPFLFRASEFALTIRKGRGKMTPLPSITDAEIADILAHLRSLKNR